MGLRKKATSAAAIAVALTVTAAGLSAPAIAAPAGTEQYTVLSADNVSAAEATATIKALGGQIVSTNEAVGMFSVVASSDGFAEKAMASSKLTGATRNRVVGRAPQKSVNVEKEGLGASSSAAAANRSGRNRVGLDPLDDKLWGLEMVRSDRARRVQPGDKRVSVGILDTGVDASNPDIAANFNWSQSRNFAPDKIDIDGPCEVASCLDPVGTDDNGHGTHVAGTIGAAANGVGVSGVAPGVSLVELKGGQDSGFFFLEPVVNALVHAGNVGLDVVNMSFFVDPWLYNCTANPADSPAQQAEQRTTIAAMFRALTFAHFKGVTLVGALGNNHEDLGAPRTDIQSPNYPANSAFPRPIDNASCWDLPAEGPFVIGVSSVGPSTAKADYSNYGRERIGVAAPGGYFRDGFGTPTHRTNDNLILSTYPLKVLQEEGRVDAAGNVLTADVFKACTASGACGYYTYLQGTSMAAPHAAGVAALIVSEFGRRDRGSRGLTLEPWKVEFVLYTSAAEHACPEPRLFTYTNEGRPAEFNALCEGGREFNGFYGFGIVDAYAAVTARPWWD